ncbi:MAG: DUF998 domain-containing protein [Candidatus Bathyarchaeia archaeon]|jgi:hypothetical membrane protein
MRKTDISAAAGMISPFFTYACIMVAIGSWKQFSWTDNALSDLGVQSGITAPVFNIGLIVGGILFVVFAAGMFRYMGKNVVGKAASVLLAVACIALVCIGIFNENFHPTHYIVSVMLFVFLPISMLTFVGAFWMEGKRKLSLFTLGLGLFAAAVWVLQLTLNYVPHVAIPEFTSGLAGSIWVIVLSWQMLKKPETPSYLPAKSR